MNTAPTYEEIKHAALRLPVETRQTLQSALQLETAERQQLLTDLAAPPALRREVKVRRVEARDYTRESDWLRANAQLYPGEHLAVSGAQLLAHDPDLGKVLAHATATGLKFLLHYTPPAADVRLGGFWL